MQFRRIGSVGLIIPLDIVSERICAVVRPAPSNLTLFFRVVLNYAVGPVLGINTMADNTGTYDILDVDI